MVKASPNDLLMSMKACLKNANRLLDDAQALEFEKPRSTKYFLSMIAQEECSKGFLLYLVSINLVPWDQIIFKATKNHECKQLLGLIIEFLNPSWEDFEKRMKDWKEKIDKGILEDLPDHVVDAINVFRYKKIEKWRGKNWFWVNEPEWDKKTVKIAKGKLDEHKQNALYVCLDKAGRTTSEPEIIRDEEANIEFERGNRFVNFLRNLIDSGPPKSLDYEHVVETFRFVFWGEGKPPKAAIYVDLNPIK